MIKGRRLSVEDHTKKQQCNATSKIQQIAQKEKGSRQIPRDSP